jgi:hypothetical protein
MTCPSCTGYGHRGYDRRERPIPCRKCRGTGRIGPAEPQRQTPPTASERAEYFREYNAALIATRDLHCSCGRPLAEHERPCISDVLRASKLSAVEYPVGEIRSGSLIPIPDLLP